MRKSPTQPSIQPQVAILYGRAKVLSTDIARDFGRPHERVLRDIAKLVKKFPPEHALNAEGMFRDVEIVQGGMRKEIFYYISQDGWLFLADAIKGKKHLHLKRSYLMAMMEANRA